MKRRQDMRINDPRAYRTMSEADLLSELLDMKDRCLLEFGCAAAHMTRLLAEQFGPREIVATEVFFQVPGLYESWQVFEDRFLNITHTRLDIDQARRAQIRSAFERHMAPSGASFLKPHRVDLLRKPG